MKFLGKEITLELIKNLIISVVAKIIGKKAAEKLIAEILKKFPWWGEWLGPIMWSISIGWLAIDLLGPAYRKTIPILLYFGTVGLRDGPEDGDDFWS